MIRVVPFLILLFSSFLAQSQSATDDNKRILLTDINVQIEATEGINSMYNFDFKRADSQFRWIQSNYPWHPIPEFLMALSQWWRIMPNISNTEYDDAFLLHINKSIDLAENIFENGNQIEGAFFLASAYAFKGRYYSERRAWAKAASMGEEAVDYLDICRGQEGFSPEILFGDGLYNYYIEWIRDNYPLLKPFLVFFEDGDQEKGLRQLKEASNNAFYTRTEAQYFLMRLQSNELNDIKGALFTSEYLHDTYPNNAYFERYYARLLYRTGQRTKCEEVSLSILSKIDSSYLGYEENSGRYASFFLAQNYVKRQKTKDLAEKYYLLGIKYGDAIDAQEKGYYVHSLYALGKIEEDRGNETEAIAYYKKVKKYTKRGDNMYIKAKNRIKRM